MEREGWLIEEAAEGDIPELCKLLALLFELEQDFAPDSEKQRRALRLFLEVSHATVLIARKEGKVAGMCAISLAISTAEGGWSGEIEDLVIAPEFRRQGLAKLLLDESEKWCRQRGALRMRLNCDDLNFPAIELYEKLGWEKSHLFIMFKR